MPKVDRFMLDGAADAETPAERVLALIREQLGRIQYGSIALSIHDGRVVQIEVSEKTRFA